MIGRQRAHDLKKRNAMLSPKSPSRVATTDPAPRLRRLIIDRPDGGFDIDRDILLGPWCAVDVEDMLPDLDTFQFADPFPTGDDRAEADVATRALANELVFDWANELNRRHNVNLDIAYWHPLLIIWLVTIVRLTWHRYRYIEETINSFGNEVLSVDVLIETPEWKFQDFEDVLAFAAGSMAFDLWLSSIILRELAPDSWCLTPMEIRQERTLTTKQFPTLAKRGSLSALIHRLTGRLAFSSAHGVRGWKLLFSLLLELAPRRPHQGTTLGDKADTPTFPPRFLTSLKRVLTATLPAAFDCGFKSYRAQAKLLRYVPGRVSVDNLATPITRNRFEIAEASHVGERLVSCQHGTAYGMARFMSWSPETEYRHHGFLSWGWRKHGDLLSDAVPVPAPHLSRIANRHKRKNDTLIFVGTAMTNGGNRFDPVPEPIHWPTYRADKLIFLDSLSMETRASVYYRPDRRGVGGLLDLDEWLHAPRDLPILNGPLDKALLSCRLLVIDYPGTTMHMGLAANAPTICYWDPKLWPLCQEAEPYFANLMAANILHTDPESAATHINRIWHSEQDWWNSAAVQEARRNWCRQYARTSPFWWWNWIQGLGRLSCARKKSG